MLPAILLFSFIVLILIAKIIWDRLDLNIEVWRFREDTQYCWVFEQFQHRIEQYSGRLEHTAAGIELIKWKSKQSPDNVIYVYDEDKDIRPRWRGRWLYHVHAGKLVPLPYTLTSKASTGQQLSVEDIKAWIEADFGQSFATAIRETPFGWREILIIAILIIGLASAFFGYQTNKLEKQQSDRLDHIEQRLPLETPIPPEY